jgi:hypothetical protein
VFPSAPDEGAEAGPAVRAILAELDALIDPRPEPVLAAFCWGTDERGGARLIHVLACGERESLRVSWNHNEIGHIEIESRSNLSFQGPERPMDPAALVERLVPMVWRHIQRGGALPAGIDRFARFF